MGQEFDSDTLLRHAGFLRALARSLVGDEHAADDAVQEAYAAAWQRRGELRVDARGWLATVTANAARMFRRGDGRRSKRERRAARPEGLPDTATTAARLEMNRLVVAAVQELAEPYRSTIVARYFDGASAQAIAARDGVAIKTVHTRLRRAVEQLRGRLDRDHDRRAWSLALLPLAATKPARAATAATITGALAMKAKLALVAAVVLILVVAWYAADPFGRDAPPRTSRDVATAPAPGDGAPAKREAVADAPPDDDPRAAADEDGVELIRGLVVKTDAGADVPVQVEVYRVSRYGNVLGDPMRGEAEPNGAFAVDIDGLFGDQTFREIEVRAEHPRHVPARARIATNAHGTRVLLELKPAAVIRGVVAAPDGTPVAGARAALFAWNGAEPTGRPVEIVKTDAAGAFWLRSPHDGAVCIAALAKGWRPAHVVVEGKLRDVRDAPAIRLREGVTISGRITVNGAAPSGGASAQAWRGIRSKVGFDRCAWSDDSFVRKGAYVNANANGDYELTGLEPGTWRVTPAGVKGMHPDVWQAERRRREVDAPAAGIDFDVTAATIAVRFVLDGAAPTELHPMVTGKTAVYHHSTDARGRIELGVAPGGEYRIEAKAAGYQKLSTKITAPAAGRSATHTFTLKRERPPATLIVRLRGAPIRRAGFGLFPDGATWPIDRYEESKDGRFVLTGLRPGVYRVRVHPDAYWSYPISFFLPTEGTVTLPEDGTAELTLDVRRGGRLRVTATPRCKFAILDAEDRPVALKLYAPGDDGVRSWSEGWAGDGTLEGGPALAPGVYKLAFSKKGFVPQEMEVVVRRDEVTDVNIKLASR